MIPNLIAGITAIKGGGGGSGVDPGGDSFDSEPFDSDGGGDPGGGNYDNKTVVFALMGQSNMIGRDGPIVNPGADEPVGRIQEYIAVTDDLDTAADPLDHQGVENADTVGPGLTFAKAFLSRYPNVANIVLVGMGYGGAGFLNGLWHPSNGDAYDLGKSRWNAAWATILADTLSGEVVCGGILWLQGEDEAIDFASSVDGVNGGEEYLTMPMSMMEGIRYSGEWDGMGSTTPIVFGQIPDGSAMDYSALSNINEAIADIPNRLPVSGVALNTGLTLFDDRHYDAASCRTMGDRMETALLEALSNATTYTPPDFIEEGTNSEAAFVLDARGLPTGTPIRLSAGVHHEFDNKRVWIDNGVFRFDGDAELRWRDNGKPRLLDRDFSLKVGVSTSTVTGDQGLVCDWETAGSQRCFALRFRNSTIEFAASDNGSGGAVVLSHPGVSINTQYDIEIRRVGTALSLIVDGVTEDTHVLSGGYTFYENLITTPVVVGDYINNANLTGYIDYVSIEFP